MKKWQRALASKKKKTKGNGENIEITPPIWHSLACSNPELHLEHPFFFFFFFFCFSSAPRFCTLWVASQKTERDLLLLLPLLLLLSSMDLHSRPDHCLPERKGQKRKLEEDFEDDRQISAPPTGHARDALLSDVKDQVIVLDSTFSWKESDRAAAKRATHALADLAKNGKSVRALASFVFFFRGIRFFAAFVLRGIRFFATHALHLVLVFVCRGSGERDC